MHSRRNTWECPGGHVEKGETPLEAARRELYEETGATDYDILPLWDYSVLNDEGLLHNNGRVYYAVIRSFGKLPNYSEMKEIGFFNVLPINTTYNREDMINMFIQAEQFYKNIND